MQRNIQSDPRDPDGLRIVEKQASASTKAKWAAALLAAAAGALAVYALPSSSRDGRPEVPAAAAPRKDSPLVERRTATARPARRAEDLRAVPAAAPADAAAPAPPVDWAEEAARAVDEASREIASAGPEREEEVAKGIAKRAEEMLQAARAAGENRGIAAFPPPGTNPIRIGLVVPPDFDLPEGYIRHFQVTDDGRRLEPILMFSPDYDFVDANGDPIEIPADRIVPADIAPEGLPLRKLPMPRNPYGASLR